MENKSNKHVCDAAKHTSGFLTHLQEMIRAIEEVAINMHSFIASFHAWNHALLRSWHESLF